MDVVDNVCFVDNTCFVVLGLHVVETGSEDLTAVMMIAVMMTARESAGRPDLYHCHFCLFNCGLSLSACIVSRVAV